MINFLIDIANIWIWIGISKLFNFIIENQNYGSI